jgi:phosphoribosylformimino-5-aminoimidazole carboxamide ribotide isomerase
MLVVPAIDVLGDEAVRLEQGDVGRVVLRRPDPAALARWLAAAGAELVHLVDLDGARSGRIRPQLVARIAEAAAPARVQASGGVRALADAEALLAAGASRVVVGTAAFAGSGLLEELVAGLGDRLVAAVDARDGLVRVAGWRGATGIGAGDAAERLAAAGVPRLFCTATQRDGTLAGPDVGLVSEVVARSELPVLAAGGVRDAADVARLAAAGVEGVVVGRAVLEGRLEPLRLAEAAS